MHSASLLVVQFVSVCLCSGAGPVVVQLCLRPLLTLEELLVGFDHCACQVAMGSDGRLYGSTR